MKGTRYLLDTDTCVDHLRGVAPLDELLVTSMLEAAISSITLVELLYGAARSDRPRMNRETIAELVESVPVLALDWNAGLQFAQIKSELQDRGLIISDFDLLIGATALAHDLTLVTSNTSHFDRIPQLKLENWREANG